MLKKTKTYCVFAAIHNETLCKMFQKETVASPLV